MEEKRKAAYRGNNVVFIWLVILTIGEFVIALYSSSAAILFIVALLKTYLIVNYFMHIYRLWREEAH